VSAKRVLFDGVDRGSWNGYACVIGVFPVQGVRPDSSFPHPRPDRYFLLLRFFVYPSFYVF